MNKLSFFTAVSGMYDAFLKGILTTSRDVACRVFTTTTTDSLIKRLRVVLLLCGLLCAANMTAKESGTTRSLSWHIANETLNISGTGTMPSYNYQGNPWDEFTAISLDRCFDEDAIVRIQVDLDSRGIELSNVSYMILVITDDDGEFIDNITLQPPGETHDVTVYKENLMGRGHVYSLSLTVNLSTAPEVPELFSTTVDIPHIKDLNATVDFVDADCKAG